jgi:conjugative relaxase-like TrwC/TraI family protein
LLEGIVLDIGKLSPGATEYYVGEVASSAEDYYSGRGEHPGRWVGSLALELGLKGQVDPDHFRRVLSGQHPFTGEDLVTAQGSAARAAKRRGPTPDREVLPDLVDSLRAAAHLGVSARYVRRLLAEGDRYRARLADSADGDVVAEPSAYLLGVKADGNGQAGSDAWTVGRGELERFASSRPRVKARPGYDLTLRPPKSVSVLWALADEGHRVEIRRAHAQAVDEVVRYYETNAVFAREGGGQRRLISSAGIVAAAFDHRTSRAGDPLLHTHVVTANMTNVDGAESAPWRAIAGIGLYEHARAAGHLYQAHLRHLLGVRLGVQFTPVVNGHADVLGVPDAVTEAFSKRRAEIEEVLAESASRSARAAQVATLDTRQAKDYGVDVETLEERWCSEAASAGFGASEVAACFGREAPAPLEPALIERCFDMLVGAHGLTERSATFRRTDVIEALASAAGASATAAQLEVLADRFLTSDRVLLVDRTGPVQTSVESSEAEPWSVRSSVPRSPTQKLYTVPELVDLEARLLSWADPAVRTAALLDTHAVERAITRRGELSDEQRVMVRAVCCSGEFVQPVAGRPGAGKTYALEAVVAAHCDVGVPIIGCAVSATAAAELEGAAGFARSTGAQASTVARLLWDLGDKNAPGLAAGTVVVVDEASMLGTRDLARLASHVRGAGGAIRLIGDPDQHGSVDVGGLFRRLCAERGDGLVRLIDNNRQQDHTERLAIAEYRDGHVADALSRYDEAGKVVRSQTAGESFDAIVADWYAARLHDRVDPMIAGPNSTRRALNDRARALLKANGELTGEPLVMRGREFMVGDEVVARRNERRLHAVNGNDFVKNGSSGTIVDTDVRCMEVVVAFEREGTIRIPSAYLAAGRLEHGYARTSYGVQGATHEVARYHPTDVSSFEEGYVALTRGRQSAHIYIVDGDQLEADNEFTHAPAESRPTGIGDIAQALIRRRSAHMAADASADLGAVAQTLAGATLAQLAAQRRQLDDLLGGAPADMSDTINQAHHAIESIATRRRAWNDLLRTAETASTGSPGRHDDQGASRRARAAIVALDRSLTHVSARLENAERQQAQRHDWFDTHSDLLAEHNLARRAERARETQVRIAAINTPDGAVIDILGPEPTAQRERLQWRRAVETTAIYNARHPQAGPTDGGRCEQLLGTRPADTEARHDYDLAVWTINAAIAARPATREQETDLGMAL